MLEVYEVFDASNEELLSELQNLQQLLRTAAGPHHVQYKMLYDTVRQELEERGVSNKVFQQLSPAMLQFAQPTASSSFGLFSPGPLPGMAGAPPNAAPHTALTLQPMAALYSFGSRGGGGSTTSGSTTAVASSYGHAYGYHGMPPVSSSGIAQAVNAMVAATVRNALPLTLQPQYNGSAVGRPPPAPPLPLAALPPPPVPPIAPAPPQVAASQVPAPITVTAAGKPSPRTPPAAVLISLPPSLPSPGPSGSTPPLTPSPALTPSISVPVSLAASHTPSPQAANGGGGERSGSGDEVPLEVEESLTPAEGGPGPCSGTSSPGPGMEGAAEGQASGAGGGGGSGKQLTPWEAAMLAFQEEQRLLRKARKAIRKGPPTKPGAKKPITIAAAAAPASGPPALGAESSHGSSRQLGAKPARSTASGAGGTAQGPGRPPGAPRASGPTSPQGAAAAVASSRGAAAPAAPGSSGSSKAGGSAGSGAGRSKAAGVAAAGGGGGHAVSAGGTSLATPAGTAAGAGAGATVSTDAEAVPEEQGLQGRTVAVAAAGMDAEAESSEPGSVKTDEETGEMVAAAMREMESTAATAGRRSGPGTDPLSDPESDPESVSSGSHLDNNTGRSRGGPIQLSSPGPRRPAAQSAPTGRSTVFPASAALSAPRTMSACQSASAERASAAASGPSTGRLPGQPTLVLDTSSSTIAVRQAAGRGVSEAAAGGGPRNAWTASATDVTAGMSAERPKGRHVVEAEEVETESGSDTEEGDDEESSASEGLVTPGVRRRAQTGEWEDDEARQRAIAAAAAAAIQGRSAFDVAAYVSDAHHLARAVVAAEPLKVDRWADWELADSCDGVSAWAMNDAEDPMRGGHLRAPRPVGQHAPPEALIPGPLGALAAPVIHSQQQHPRLSGGGGIGSSRQGQRPSEGGAGAAPTRVGSAPHSGGSTTRRNGAVESPRDSGCSDGEGDVMDGGAVVASSRGDPQQVGGRPAASLQQQPPQPLPRSGVVPAGCKPANGVATGTVVANTGTSSANSTPPSSSRRPPLAPTTTTSSHQSPPASTSRSTSTGAASRGGSPANTGSGAAAPSDSSDAPNPAAAYLQCYSAFHDILTVCYSSLPVMLDAAALSSASFAIVAGGGGGGSRPQSRMLATSGGTSCLDLMERYASLLARCEAWQAKLRQFTSGMPLEDTGDMATTASTAPIAITTDSSPLLRPTPSPNSSSGGGSGGGSNNSPNASDGGGTRLSSPRPPPPIQTLRYVAVIDDTAHTEVRQVMTAALRLLSPGWALDPADQLTEVAKAEDDDMGSGGSTLTGGGGSFSRPHTAASNSRAQTPAAAIGWGLFGPPASSTGTASGSASGLGSPRLGHTAGASGVGGGGSGGTAGGGSGSGSGSGGPKCHVWNVMWSWSVRVRVPINELLVWQRVNHFPEARQLTRKDLLKKHLARYQTMHNTGRSASLFDRLTPTTFVLPKEGAAFEEAFVRALHGVEPTCVQPMGLNLWIQKPVGLSRGRGISLISSLKRVNTSEAMVVQRYITEPLLVDGHKFDLRLYVLVTSFNPLEAWMYEEGFARFTTLPYTLDESQLDNMHVHLTNSAVQKSRAEAGQLPGFLQAAEPAGGSKTSLATLRQLLARRGVDWSLLWTRACEVATATLFAAQDAIPHCPNSFELFGFDLVIDAELKVWLLEVNSSPSMGLDTPLDQVVKPRLIADVLELLAPLAFDREALAAVLRARTATGRGGRRGASGLLSGTASEEREWCCADLQAVLGGALPRRYGEKPRNPGGFTTCLAPSPFHDRLLKLRRPLP